MSAAAKSRLVAKWRSARRLYPLYAALATKYSIVDPPYGPDLRNISEEHERDVLADVDRWLAEMDERIEAHQFRYILQSTELASTEPKLYSLVQRYLNKAQKTDADRDKLDFLLAHYFGACAPPSFHKREVKLDDVAAVLEPLLGEASTLLPEWLAPLDELIAALTACSSLRQLDEQKIIARGRSLKLACKQMYFGTAALIAFTRFNYLVRRSAYRMVKNDLDATRRAVEQLVESQVASVDCSAAGLGNQTPTALRQMLKGWLEPTFGEYTGDTGLRQAMQLRQAVENECARQRAATTPGEGGETRIRKLEQELEALTAAFHDVQGSHQETRIARLEAQVESLAAALRGLTGGVRAAAQHTPVPAAQASPAHGENGHKPNGHATASATVSAEGNGSAHAAPAAASHGNGNGNGHAHAAALADSSVNDAASDELYLTAAMDNVTEQLMAGNANARTTRKTVCGNIRIAGTVILMNDAEVGAFLSPETDPGGRLRRAVGARALLVETIETNRTNPDSGKLTAAVRLADAESRRLEETLKAVEKNSDTAACATAARKQLSTIAQHARRMISQARA